MSDEERERVIRNRVKDGEHDLARLVSDAPRHIKATEFVRGYGEAFVYSDVDFLLTELSAEKAKVRAMEAVVETGRRFNETLGPIPRIFSQDMNTSIRIKRWTDFALALAALAKTAYYSEGK